MMGLERTALPTSWGRIGPECLNLTVPLQTLALDRQNKPFDVSVQIRRTVRQPNDVRSGVLEQIAKLRGELLVAVQDAESLAAQKAVERVGEIPTDLVVSKNTNELKRSARRDVSE